MALTGSVEDIGDGRDGSWVGQVAGALKLNEALQLHMTTPAAGFASSAVGQGQSAASCAELESDGSLELSYGEEVRTLGSGLGLGLGLGLGVGLGVGVGVGVGLRVAVLRRGGAHAAQKTAAHALLVCSLLGLAATSCTYL